MGGQAGCGGGPPQGGEALHRGDPRWARAGGHPYGVDEVAEARGRHGEADG